MLAVLQMAGANLDMTVGRAAKGGCEPARTPLYQAASQGHLPMVQELLRLGCGVNRPSKDNESPLWIASRRGHLKVCSALIDARAAINAQCLLGEFPLYKAAEFGHVRVVELLLGAGADLDLVDTNGGSALDVARAGGSGDGDVYHGKDCAGCAALLERAGQLERRPCSRPRRRRPHERRHSRTRRAPPGLLYSSLPVGDALSGGRAGVGAALLPFRSARHTTCIYAPRRGTRAVTGSRPVRHCALRWRELVSNLSTARMLCIRRRARWRRRTPRNRGGLCAESPCPCPYHAPMRPARGLRPRR